MGLDRTSAQRRLRRAEKRLVRKMKKVVRLYRQGKYPEQQYGQIRAEFDKAIKELQDAETAIGMDLRTIDLSS